MTFQKYQHIERVGTSETDGLFDGVCYFFPKIDGTNGSVWFDNGIKAASRNRELSIDNDNAGFYAASLNDERINGLLAENKTLRLFGEWLVPHSLKTYRDDAWRKFYVFDVFDEEKLLHYNDYQPILERHGVDYIPPIFFIDRPSEDRVYKALELNSFLIKDGEGVGEGVVIKRYDFVNRFGRTTWGKAVTSEFKAKHIKAMGPLELKEKVQIEDVIASEFVTKSIVDKVYAKIECENGGFSSKDIPRLLNTVFYDIVREDIWEIIKQHKNPTIDFGRLMKAVFYHAKIYRPEIFGFESKSPAEAA